MISRAHPALPPPSALPWLACAAACWAIAAVGGPGPPRLLLAGAVTAVALRLGYPWAAVAAVAVTASATFATAALEPLPAGEVTLEGTMATDVIEGRFGPWAMMSTEEGPVLIDLDGDVTVARGDRVLVEGRASGESGVARGEQHRGVVKVRRLEVTGGPSSPLLMAGNAVRDRVVERLMARTPGKALLAGFLIGDTSGMDEIDISAMRRSGLAHFTAVSGRNVALFLGLLFVAAGPLGLDPRRRAILGLAALPVYAAATAFTPSVLRASVMAGVALTGRLIGIVLESWQLLGLAVVLLLIADPGFTSSVGLQLSAAGTAGVLLGARWPLSPGLVRRALAVTVGAQLAVAPLLLLHFGEVPVASPLANLVAAPLVAAATLAGAVGVAGLDPLVAMGGWLSEIVLMLARSVAGWPQLGLPGVVGVAVAALVYARHRPLRGAIAIAGAALVVAALAPWGQLPSTGVVVLDMGQGDAILLVGGHGRFALFDAGPDPVVIHDKLARHGVRSLDLVVLSHVHADHIEGLTGLTGRLPIGRVWHAFPPHETPSSARVIAALDEHGIPVETPMPGLTVSLGSLTLEVVAPLRRYASANDQSIVLLVSGPGRSMLLTGDIEVAAQADLMGVTADVLQVPHHGAGTSDPDWLKQVGAGLAVVSAGADNTRGHPVPWVIETLEGAGIEVRRTDTDGDVVIALD